MRVGFSLSWLLASIVIATTFAGSGVEFDRDTDFSNYRTYQWNDGTPAPDEGVQALIERAIDERLQASGLASRDSGGDLIVVTHISTARNTLAGADDFGYGGWPGWGASSGMGESPAAEDSELPGGTLIVDLVDAETNKLVWRGVASGTIKGSSEKTHKNVDKKIGKLFRNFPPSHVD